MVKRRQTRIKATGAKWKRVEVKRRQEKFKAGLRVLGYVATGLLVIAGVGVGVKTVVGSRLTQDRKVVVAGAWSRLGVLVVDPVEERGVWVELPDEMLIDATHGYGEYKAGVMAALDKQERRGGELVEESLAQYFGALVEGYIVREEGREITRKEDALRILGQTFLGQIAGKRETNFSLWDVVRLTWWVASLRGGEFRVINVVESGAVEAVRLPDESVAYMTDPERLELLARELLVDETLAQEGIEVVVVNAAGEGGLAGRFARVLNRSGIQVVAADSSSGEEVVSRIVVADKVTERSETVVAIEKYLGVRAEINGQQMGQRAKVVVTLGEDYEMRLTGK